MPVGNPTQGADPLEGFIPHGQHAVAGWAFFINITKLAIAEHIVSRGVFGFAGEFVGIKLGAIGNRLILIGRTSHQ